MNEDRMRELFAEMRAEDVPADSLVRVRERVRERVSWRRRPFAWVAALTGAAAMLLMIAWPAAPPLPGPPRMALGWPRVPESAMPHGGMGSGPAAPRDAAGPAPGAAPRVPSFAAVRAIPRHAALSTRAVPSTGDELAAPRPATSVAMIRIETPDPDVVIFLTAGE